MFDLTFQTYGRLWVLNPVGKAGDGSTNWLCLCECGNRAVVNMARLRAKRTMSCNCLRRDASRERCKVVGKANRTHGHKRSESPTYGSWQAMRHRCADPTDRYYGERGITVCERWESFANFLADMGERPAGHTLDRVDNEGNYEPGNCRWATRKQQANNRRPPRKIAA